jgi:trk system potassium uptake protein TrkA
VRVAIAGAGSVGTFIARDLLSAGHEILLIEQRPDVIGKLSPTLDVSWLNADACEVASLAEAGLEKSDVFVAATGDDEDNLVMALLAKQEFAVPRVIARVNHPKNEWLFNEAWGVDVSVSTPHLISALVEEAVSVGSVVRLLQFDRGATRLVEVTLAENSPVVNQTLSELTLPRGGSVVAMIRGDHVIVPRGDTTLTPGDEVVVLVSADSEDAIRAMFTREI